jgi:hypothetical protein
MFITPLLKGLEHLNRILKKFDVGPESGSDEEEHREGDLISSQHDASYEEDTESCSAHGGRNGILSGQEATGTVSCKRLTL